LDGGSSQRARLPSLDESRRLNSSALWLLPGWLAGWLACCCVVDGIGWLVVVGKKKKELVQLMSGHCKSIAHRMGGSITTISNVPASASGARSVWLGLRCCLPRQACL
jgi:hypothetical protein